MRTLLVGLDNPHSKDPSMALYPLPREATGWRIVQLIKQHDDDYSKGKYLLDFARCNLHPVGRAPSGAGARAKDRDAAMFVMYMAAQLNVDEVVAFGRRVTGAFSEFCTPPEFLQSKPIERGHRIVRLWSLPHPSGRNYWYNDIDNARAAGRLLCDLRHRTQIPHRVAPTDEEIREMMP